MDDIKDNQLPIDNEPEDGWVPMKPSQRDLITDFESSTSIPSIWIGSIDGKHNNSLITPSYGYFYMRTIEGTRTQVKPVVNASIVDTNAKHDILYIHVTSKGLEGVYKIIPKESSTWELYVATGSNSNQGIIDGTQIFDTTSHNNINDMYVDNGTLYLLSEMGIGMCKDTSIEMLPSSAGFIGADSSNGTEVRIKDDRTIVFDGKIAQSDKIIPRTEVPSYIKYISNDPLVYVLATRDEKGYFGYAAGSATITNTHISGDILALGSNRQGTMCYVDKNGGVYVNTYDKDSESGFDQKNISMYRNTIPVDGFRVTVAVGKKSIYVISTMDSERRSSGER